MDATPVTLGQEFGGYAAAVRYGVERLDAVLPRVAELPLGGTAVGTGINTPPGFAAKVIARLAGDLGLPLTEARDHFEAQASRDALVECTGVLRTNAVSLYKIANDLRWMGSGPRAGLAEIHLPDLQPGSSIMPGKVNPVIPEAVCQVVAQVVGNDAAVAFGGTAGNFELNVMLPVIGRNLLESIRILANISRLLADRCVDGITADVERCRRYAESSASIVTPLNRYIGYEEAAKVAKQSLAEEKTIREVVVERGYIEDGQAHRGAAGRRPRRAVDDPAGRSLISAAPPAFRAPAPPTATGGAGARCIYERSANGRRDRWPKRRPTNGRPACCTDEARSSRASSRKAWSPEYGSRSRSSC